MRIVPVRKRERNPVQMANHLNSHVEMSRNSGVGENKSFVFSTDKAVVSLCNWLVGSTLTHQPSNRTHKLLFYEKFGLVKFTVTATRHIFAPEIHRK